MKWLIVLMLAAGPALSHASNNNMDVGESRKIDYLISVIESLENAEFIRNGKVLHVKVAANNFRLKLKKTRCNVGTAEAFIRICASASWASGVPYEIRFDDGSVVLVKDYLREKLEELDAGDFVDVSDKI